MAITGAHTNLNLLNMKTLIIYIVALFLAASTASTYSQTASARKSLLIQAIDPQLNAAVLHQTASILTSRLKSFSSEKFQITEIPAQRQIRIDLSGKWDFQQAQSLVLNKGRLQFFESYDPEKGSKGLAPLLTGSDIESVAGKQERNSHGPEIEILFKKTAVTKWAEATLRNLNKPIAIVLDEQLIFSPVTRSQIPNGKCMISGNFSDTEIRYFVAMTQHGELPAEFYLVK